MRIKKHSFHYVLLGVMALFLTFCSNGDTGPVPLSPCQTQDDCKTDDYKLECRASKCREVKENQKPVADISFSPASPKEQQKVSLYGAGSVDPDSDTLLFKWEFVFKPKQSQAVIEDADQETAYFIADFPGNYIVKLVVTDDRDDKLSSEPKEIEIKVRALNNTAPIADAGPDQTVGPQATVQLDGTNSSDPEGHALTYNWIIQSNPAGSNATIKDSGAEKPTFDADKEGRYVVSLTVKDSRDATSSPDTITIISMQGHDKQPVLTSIDPKKALLGERVKVTLKGKDFVAGAERRLDTKAFKTDYVSDGELTATIDTNGMTAKQYKVRVFNPNGKSTTSAHTFDVEGIPAPVLTSLTPPKSYVGLQIKVKAIGNNFFDGNSVVVFDGITELKTTVLSKTEIEFELDLRNVALGEYSVAIRNQPGNLTSKELKFNVEAPPPNPVLNVLNPPQAKVDEKIAFSVHGIGFDRGAVIYFNEQPLKTKYIRRDELQVDGGLDLKALGLKPGVYEVFVRNPGSQDSNKESFRVSALDPTPNYTRALPFNLYVNEVMENVAVYGYDFVKGAKFVVDGKEITETPGPYGQVVWKSDTYMEVKVILTDVSKWTVGKVNTQVINPSGKKSGIYQMTVTYRVPALDSLLPSAWTTKCDTDVEVFGINFVKKAEVHFGSTVYSTTSTTNKLTYVSDKKLKFNLKATKMTAGSYNVFVKNGPNAQSQPATFQIDNASALTPFPRYASPSVGQADTKVAMDVYPLSTPSSSYRSFKPGAYIEIDGKKMPTTCVQSSDYCYRLEVNADLSGFKPGLYEMFVVNPCGVKSSPLSFFVEPAPNTNILGFVPGHAAPGDKTKIKVTGENFKQGDVIYINDKMIPTTFTSTKELETTNLVDFTGVSFGAQKVEIKRGSNVVSSAKFSLIQSFVPTISEVSNNVQQRGRQLLAMNLKGTGFVITSLVYIDGKLASSRYVSATELQISTFDATNMTDGVYDIQVKNGTRASNLMPLVLTPTPKPRINYIYDASAVAGSVNTIRIRFYGERFSTSPKATVVVTDPEGKDISSRYKIQYFSSSTYFYGDFDLAGLVAGKYTFVVKNPTGELSNPVFFSLTPPPPPVANSVNPAFVFRGVSNQNIQVIGSNLVSGDLIIFNGDELNRIPGTAKSSGVLEFVADLSKLKAGREYDVVVLRCLDKACTKQQRTPPVKLQVQNPACALINCATSMLPAGSEACDTADSVCRPKCSTTADCTALDSKATWTCQSGLCK
ncbi:MAG TPA: hypothetical protein DCE42_25550 [Myxococcales bacterium]|nr:hypothetical protein [Myxococcales bacterium]